jgi:hypothetical protein
LKLVRLMALLLRGRSFMTPPLLGIEYNQPENSTTVSTRVRTQCRTPARVGLGSGAGTAARAHCKRVRSRLIIRLSRFVISESEGCQLPTSGEPPLTTAVEPSQSSSLGDGLCP